MTVLLPNARLSVRRRIEAALDAHGDRVAGGWAMEPPLLPGGVDERGDGGWTLRLDPALWPVRAGDLIVDDQGATWLVRTADLRSNPVEPAVDWIRVDGLQQQTSGVWPALVTGTEPGGPWFTGR